MDRNLSFAFPFLFLLLLAACARAPQATPQVDPQATLAPTPEPVPDWERAGWEIVWHDEFDGAALDPTAWTYDLGAGGWGNSELQFYTDRAENIRVEDGLLTIEARQEDYHGSDYTSARIKTQALQTWTYGRIEASIRLPTAQGIWPAFWMLGEDIVSAGWPQSGEIDIVEHIGEANTIYGTVHGPGYSGGDGVGTSYFSSNGALDQEFHVYAIEWEPGEIRWYLDDILYSRVAFDDVPGEWVYNHPFFLILNLAVGGEWPGYPDANTVFPQQLLVDYVRVYRDPDLDLESLAQGEIHVDDITMAFTKVDDRWQADVYVRVVNENGAPVEGAVVDAGWLGVIAGADPSATTGPDGLAGPFTALRNPVAKEVSFCVSRVSHIQFTYTKEANSLTCLFVDPDATNTP